MQYSLISLSYVELPKAFFTRPVNMPKNFTAQPKPRTKCNFVPFAAAIILTISDVFVYSEFCGKNVPLSSFKIIKRTNSHKFSIYSIERSFLI